MRPKNIVLVHGAGGTATTWSNVAPLLTAAGYDVTLVTNPMRSLTGDVAHTAAVVRELSGPVLLVGHSYGGAVISNAGREPGVVGLVYIAAFGPDEGETVNQIVERYPPAAVSKYMRRGPNGEWSSEHTAEYWAEIGWDVPVEQRAVWDAESRQSDNAIFTEPTAVPAWRTLPSWYLVAAQDRTLRPEIQRDMAARMGATVAEVPGSHFTPRARPAEVVAFVERAVTGVAAR
ncbi:MULTISPECIES: alpha/beta fold hydrolase [unclassified Micromonospora]|uniref:alpha/beta fold hydrolase n=1 Tax=unclassified Micromonospora TaxID=2617518 RepID=UPI00363CC2C5